MKSLQSHENNPKRTRKTLLSQEERNSLIFRQYTNDIMIAQLQAHYSHVQLHITHRIEMTVIHNTTQYT